MKKYEILPHSADLKIRVFGKTKKELFKNAMIGMFESAKYIEEEKIRSKKQKISIKSTDLSSLLVDFLNELLYLVEIKKIVFKKIIFEKLTENELRAEVFSERLKEMGVQIKAVTYYGLNIKQDKNKNWQATLLFDI
jgi:SHS2 domain-containing protein